MSAYLKRLLKLQEYVENNQEAYSACTIIADECVTCETHEARKDAIQDALRNPDFLAYVAALEEFYEAFAAIGFSEEVPFDLAVESARQKLEGEGAP